MNTPPIRQQQSSRLNSLVRQRGKFILAIPVSCLITSLFAFGWLEFNTARAEDWVQHTQQVRLEAQRLLTALLDAETEVRGYALIRRPEFLTHYESAIALIPNSLDQLSRLVADNPSQTQRIQQIRGLATARVSFLQSNLQLIRSLPRTLTVSPDLESRLLEGKGTRELTRTQINEFLAEEERLQIKRDRRLRQQQQLTWLVLSLSAFIGIAGSVLAAYLLNRLEQKLIERDRNLKESEARYRTAIENFPNGSVLLFNSELRYLLGDGSALAAVGLSKEQLEGKTIWEILPAETCSAIEPLYRDALAGTANSTEIPYADRTYLTHTLPVRNETGEIFAGMMVSHDITERKLSEEQVSKVNRALKTLSECNQALVRATDEATLLHDICQNIVEFGSYRAAWIGFAEQDEAKTVRPIAQAGYQDGYLESIEITWSDTEQGRSPAGTAIRTGKVSIAQDILTDPRYLPWREAANQRGYAASISLPLIVDAKTLGALNIYATQPNAFDEAEVRLLTELANDLAYGIKALRTQMERQQAQAALRESKQRLDDILNSFEDVVWSVSATTRELLYLSPAAERVYGRPIQAFFDNPKLWLEVVHPDDLEQVSPFTQTALEMGSNDMEYRILRPDGEVRWLRDRARVTYDEQGTPLRLDGITTDITQRKQAEEALRETNQRLQALIQSSPLAITSLEPGGRVKTWNAAAERMFGWSATEVIGKPLPTVSVDDIDEFHRVLQRVLQGESITGMEVVRQKRDGTPIHISLSKAPLFDARGQIDGIMAVIADISDRKQAEISLRDSEAKFRAFLESASEAIIVTDANGAIVVFNAKAEELFGYDHTEVLGSTVEFLMPERFHQRHVAHRVAYREQPTKRSMSKTKNLFARRKDGTEFPIEAGLSPVQTKGGTFVMTFLTDITERKQAEEEIKRLNESLKRYAREIETRYQQIVELAEEGIWVIDDKAKTTYVNQAITKMLGYTESEILGHPISKFISEGTQHPCCSLINFGNLSQVEKCELKLKTSSGKDLWTYMSVSPALDENGKTLWACALVYDITERKQTEEQIKESSERISLANAELARATRLKDEFLANMSHELRTPLNAILGLSEALQEEVYGGLTDKQRKSLATIEQSGKHLLELINDILDLSKIESGKVELQIAPVSLEDLCESSLTFVRQLAHKKTIRLNSKIAEGIGDIEVDERRIRQVLVNLLSNAVKFTPEGGEVRLEVEANSEAEILQFSVIDTGIGIAPENIDKLFRPFVQLDSSLSRRYTGTGLGLALVRRVVELHGGSVSLESEVGKGSRFTVSLPWKEPSLMTQSLGDSEPTLVELPVIHKALIVEDSEPAAKHIARYFAELGAAVHIHPQGEGTIEAALQYNPDVIVLDLLLPHLSGWEVLAQLKANPATRHIPVLVVSVVDERSRALAMGASEYLLKPISRQSFQSALSRIVPESSASLGQTALVEMPQQVQQLPLILLAEDNEANISTMMDYLQVQGFRVSLARNGVEAVQRATQQKPNLILMDIQMPEMDGLQATRLIRTEAELATIPIIALTALAMPGDRERCLAAGATDYLTKPVSLKTLANTIAQYLNPSD